jgi:arylsulfatase A-like enzyme
MDLMPTLLELANIPRTTERPLDGVSLAPLLRSGADLPERTVFWSYGNQRAARQGPWKLLRTTADGARASGGRRNSPVPELALFRLDHDLGEQQDLSRQEPVRVEALRAALTAWEQSWTNMPPPRGPASSSPTPLP